MPPIMTGAAIDALTKIDSPGRLLRANVALRAATLNYPFGVDRVTLKPGQPEHMNFAQAICAAGLARVQRMFLDGDMPLTLDFECLEFRRPPTESWFLRSSRFGMPISALGDCRVAGTGSRPIHPLDAGLGTNRLLLDLAKINALRESVPALHPAILRFLNGLDA